MGTDGVIKPSLLEIKEFDIDRDEALVPEITQMLHQSYKELADKGFRYHATHQSEEVTQSRLSKGRSLLGFLDGQLASTITMVKTDSTEPCSWYQRPEVFFFTQFAVRNELKGRGYGQWLMNLVESLALFSGAQELSLDTAEGAESLIQLYQQRGYRQVEYAKWSMTNYSSVVLSKTLRHKIRQAKESYEVCYPEPLDLKSGEFIQLFAKEVPKKWLGWNWCRDSRGNEGWISESYFERNDRAESEVSASKEFAATIIRPYLAQELRVSEGDQIEVVYTDCGWAWCRKLLEDEKFQFIEGWLPIEILGNV